MEICIRVLFFVWFFSFSIIILIFITIVVSSFSLLSSIPFYGYTKIYLFIHICMDGYLQFLAVTNKGADKVLLKKPSFLQKLSVHLLYDKASIQKKGVWVSTRTFIHKCSWQVYSCSSKLETAQMSINSWIDKHTVVCPYNGLLLNNRKADTFNNVDELQNH